MHHSRLGRLAPGTGTVVLSYWNELNWTELNWTELNWWLAQLVLEWEWETSMFVSVCFCRLRQRLVTWSHSSQAQSVVRQRLWALSYKWLCSTRPRPWLSPCWTSCLLPKKQVATERFVTIILAMFSVRFLWTFYVMSCEIIYRKKTLSGVCLCSSMSVSTLPWWLEYWLFLSQSVWISSLLNGKISEKERERKALSKQNSGGRWG